MQERIPLNVTIRQNAYADRKDAFDAIVSTMFFHAAKYDDLFLRDNKLYARKEDYPYPTSLSEVKEISDNPRYAALYTAVKVIYEYLKNSEQKEWAQHINKN